MASVSRPSIASVARLASSASARGVDLANECADRERPARRAPHERARQWRIARRDDGRDADCLEQLLAHGGCRGQRIERAYEPRVAVAVAGGGPHDADAVAASFAGDGDRNAWNVRTHEAQPATAAGREQR
ncbi:MAG: hypothetical protein ACHQJ7_02625, partial [Vicinamibacteria bacterium]